MDQKQETPGDQPPETQTQPPMNYQTQAPIALTGQSLAWQQQPGHPIQAQPGYSAQQQPGYPVQQQQVYPMQAQPGYPAQQPGYSVQQQPGYQGQAVITMAPPIQISSNMATAVTATLCCCPICGIIGIIYASKVNSALLRGDVAQARNYSNNAKRWSIAAIVGGVIWVVGVIVYYIIFWFVLKSKYNYY